MNANDRDQSDLKPGPAAAGGIPAGLPGTASLRRLPLSATAAIDLLAVAVEAAADTGGPPESVANIIREWTTTQSLDPAVGVSPAPIVVPLYGCLVAWSAGRAAVVGPGERLGQLEEAVADFATHEATLRDAEQRATALLDTIEADAGAAFEIDHASGDRRIELSARYREAVAVGRRLAIVAPAVHAAPVHPPTLASQLGERLRERARLVERHELAVGRADLAERVAEACGQRAADSSFARRQTGLELAIVVLLVVQTALILVDLLARRGSS